VNFPADLSDLAITNEEVELIMEELPTGVDYNKLIKLIVLYFTEKRKL